VSSDPADPPCRIPASVYLPPPFHVYPSRLRIAATDREQLRILFLERRPDSEAALKGIDLTAEHMRCTYVPGFGLERSRLNVYIRGQREAEGHIGDVILTLTGADVEMLCIPVYVDRALQASGGVRTAHAIPLAGRGGCGCGTR
jgi:hypothetical protein